MAKHSSGPPAAAIATFPATGALGIVRATGTGVFGIVSKIFRFRAAGKNFGTIKGGTAHLGTIISSGSPIDEVIITAYRSPFSYTGEDMVEISCHGSPFILERVLSLLCDNGCAAAGPGEFTKRAFLNGKMDLTQAEAVSSLYSAKNETALRISASQLLGAEKKAINRLRAGLLRILSLIEAEIDFAHEDTEKTSQSQFAGMTEKLIAEIDSLVRNADDGIRLKNGIRLVITGRPNTGKSSLMNRLLKKDRAIVTHVAGTTRDILAEELVVDGVPFRIIDTAGIRTAKNAAEKEGVRRTAAAVKQADIVAAVFDGSKKLSAADRAVFREAASRKKPVILAVNKSDLKPAFTDRALIDFLGAKSAPVIRLSALKNRNTSALTITAKNIIMGESPGQAADPAEILVSSLRHRDALVSAGKCLRSALKNFRLRRSYEFAAHDLKQAASRLSGLTGEITPDNLLEKIFGEFCIGK